MNEAKALPAGLGSGELNKELEDGGWKEKKRRCRRLTKARWMNKNDAKRFHGSSSGMEPRLQPTKSLRESKVARLRPRSAWVSSKMERHT